MHLGLQLQREPVGEILERTLASFFRAAGWGDVRVQWHCPAPAPRPEGSWRCSFFLNAIFRDGASPQALRDLVEVFAHSSSPWRYLFQSPYAHLAAHRVDAVVCLSADLPGQDDLVVFVGNHRLRLLDARRGRCWVVPKDGFPTDTLRTDAEARASAAAVPSPRVLELTPAFLVEEYVRGLPLNRVGAKPRRETVLREACAAVAAWSISGARPEPARDGAERVLARIRATLATGTAALRPLVPDAVPAAEALARRAAGLPETRRGPAHGDFQAGNILVQDGGYRIIDWEFAGERFVGYDGFVQLLALRSQAGIADRLRSWLCGAVEPGLLAAWEIPDAATHRAGLAALVLLEDLEFHLRLNAAPRLAAPTPGVEAYVRLIRDISTEL